VETPVIPPKVEVCLLEDETGSFFDDIANLQAAASGIYDAVVAGSPDARFAVAGFRDYPVDPYGSTGDWVYRLLSPMDPDKADWLAGVAALGAGGGGDEPEAQYDAIVAAVAGIVDPTLGSQAPCGFTAAATKVLVVATDDSFHPPPDGTHVNDAASTIAALAAAGGVKVVGLKAPGAGTELDDLALATGGSVQPLSADGANIAEAILAGLGNLPVTVSMTSDCEAPIGTSFRPASVTEVESGDTVFFKERISVANDALPGTYECNDWVLINGEPMTDEAGNIIYEHKTITVLDGLMTGGGSLWFNQDVAEDTTVAVRATHGMELHCASAVTPNTLQVNWKNDGSKRFHLQTLDYAKCSDSRRIDEGNPEAGFDTIEGRGTGKYNNVPGATVRFKFTDAGEPGTEDAGYIQVWDENANLVLSVRSKLEHGNQQAHPLP